MSEPLSPPPLTSPQPERLLAYLGNGHLGLRVGRIPTLGGRAVVNGLWGGHPKDGIPTFALAPYPFLADLRLGGQWLSESGADIRFVHQRLEFATGELTSRFAVDLEGVRATVDVVSFVSRTDPALALQELRIRCDPATEVAVRSSLCTAGIGGEWADAGPIPHGEPPTADAFLQLVAMGGETRCGAVLGVDPPIRGRGPGRPEIDRRVELDAARGLVSVIASYSAAPLVVHRTIAGLVPELAHPRPARQAGLLVARGLARGWEELRAANRQAWAELWRARPVLAAPGGWQERADAAFFYLHSSISGASLASTGVFGLAHAPDYHVYRGHVMWDIESFAYPPLVLTDPDAARAVLRFRSRTAPAARANAALHGTAGLLYPWETDFAGGDESVPRWSKTDKDHVSLDVGLAFTRYCAVSGDRLFGRIEALPVVAGVAEWLLSRVEWTARGAEIRHARGPAEAYEPVHNDAWVNLSAIVFLRRAAALLRSLGEEAPEAWEAVAARIVVPTDPATGAILNHDDWTADEPLGETPEAAAAFFPLGYRHAADVEAATLDHALGHQVERYVGTPMFSALLGVFAAWRGDRERSADLFERGFADFIDDPFLAPDEYPKDDIRFPQASPMLANLGAFLSSLLTGLPGILPTFRVPGTWPERPVVLPAGWQSIEVDRLWVRGRPARLVARHGDPRATLELGPAPWMDEATAPEPSAGRRRPAALPPAVPATAATPASWRPGRPATEVRAEERSPTSPR
jgi:glycosyl hydrolase family 65